MAPLRYRNDGNGALLAMVPARPGRVLDCGCGPGDNAALLRRAGWTVTGITLDPAERAAAEPFCDRVLVADLEDGLPAEATGPYELILASHVVEHLADPTPLLADARLRLAPDGLLAMAVPNLLQYRQRLQLLRGSFEYSDTGVLDRTHLRFYTVATARRLLVEAGFEIVAAQPDGGLPWRGLRLIVPARLRSRLDRWALARWPGLLAWQCLFTARPADRARR